MSNSSIEALACAWAQLASEVAFPSGYEGTASPAAQRASQAIQDRMRQHIVATQDMRLFGLRHLLGQASLRMEEALWPEEYDRFACDVEEALLEADAPGAKADDLEEVMLEMQASTNLASDKPDCADVVAEEPVPVEGSLGTQPQEFVCPLDQVATCLQANAERYLESLRQIEVLTAALVLAKDALILSRSDSELLLLGLTDLAGDPGTDLAIQTHSDCLAKIDAALGAIHKIG